MFRDGKLVNPEVRIENTSKCNAACIMCPREKLTRPQVTMCWGKFVSLLDQCVKLGARAVSIFGYGEPLLDREIAKKVESATEMCLETYITTNCSLLDLNMAADLLDAGLKNIRVSIHATTPLRYNAVHRKLDWLWVWRNFANFVKLNDHRGHPCMVHLTAMPLNGESVDEIRQTWEKYVDYLEIWKPHNWTDGRTYRAVQVRRKTCGRPFNGPLQINADGTMMVCCFDYDAKMVIGDTEDETIETILTSPKLGLIQMAHRMGWHEGLICSTCDQLNMFDSDVLLYSSRDPECKTGVTSSCKIAVSGN